MIGARLFAYQLGRELARRGYTLGAMRLPAAVAASPVALEFVHLGHGDERERMRLAGELPQLVLCLDLPEPAPVRGRNGHHRLPRMPQDRVLTCPEAPRPRLNGRQAGAATRKPTGLFSPVTGTQIALHGVADGLVLARKETVT